jgi:hypothetical protein
MFWKTIVMPTAVIQNATQYVASLKPMLVSMVMLVTRNGQTFLLKEWTHF